MRGCNGVDVAPSTTFQRLARIQILQRQLRLHELVWAHLIVAEDEAARDRPPPDRKQSTLVGGMRHG